MVSIFIMRINIFGNSNLHWGTNETLLMPIYWVTLRSVEYVSKYRFKVLISVNVTLTFGILY